MILPWNLKEEISRGAACIAEWGGQFVVPIPEVAVCDERRFCSPGFDQPVGHLTRSPNGAYPAYHSSADELDIVLPDRIAESIGVLARLASVLDANRLQPKAEVRLGKRGLHHHLGGTALGAFEHALLRVRNPDDGAHDLIAVAERSELDFDL